MKKLILLLIVFTLIGCENTKEVKQKPPEKIEKEVVEFVPEIESVDTDVMRVLVSACNEKTRVIELESLHAMIVDDLLDNVDLEIDLTLQEALITEIVEKHLKTWQYEIVINTLAEKNVSLHNDDLETLIQRTSIKDAYHLMLGYEKVFLKHAIE